MPRVSGDPVTEGGLLYPPTDTENWLKCPAYRDYNKRWHPRDNDWTPNLLLGEALHAGLALYYHGVKAGHPVVEADALAAADQVLEAGYVPQPEWALDGLRELVTRGLRVTLATEPLPPGAQVVCVERTMHRCRPDLVWRTPAGLVVHDWKARLDLEKKWEDAALREFFNSWQLRHNAWAVQATYGEPVVECSIGMIALAPRARYLHYPVPMNPRRLLTWEQDAKLVWARMSVEEPNADGTRPVAPPRNMKACWTFPSKDRRCPFYDACHNLDRDESLFPPLYEEVLR